MQKKEFTYQNWYLRILCSGIVLPIVAVIQIIAAQLVNMESWIYLLLCGVIAVIGFTLYYRYTENKKWFLNNNRQLKKDKNLAYWYERKEEL